MHEAGGTNVAVARIVAGREAPLWRLHGNLLFEMPLAAPTRDPVDVIMSVGWAARLTPALAIGVEGLGEDLEGFWDPTEAEGGGRVLVGPSVHVAPSNGKWQFTVAGGPVFHASGDKRSSAAWRDLPPTTQPVSYAIKAGLTCWLH